MHRKNFIFIIFLFSSIISVSQKIYLLDKESRRPITDAFVIVNSEVFFPDTQGVVLLKAHFKPDDQISITANGYLDLLLTYGDLKKNNFRIFLEANVFDIEPITISANKWEKKTTEVPVSVSPINLSKLDFINPQTTADLIGTNPFVYVQKSQLGGGSPMIRGFAANRVLIAVDGVRMNNAIYRSGNLQNIISLDANYLADAEIVFGPGSLNYGSDALGGVMDFHTVQPVFSENRPVWSLSSLERFSSASREKTYHLDFSLGMKRIAFFTSYTFSDFSDLKMGSFGPDEYLRKNYVEVINDTIDILVPNDDKRLQRYSGYKSYQFLQKVSLKFTEHTFATYSLFYSSTSDIPRYDRLIQTEEDLPKYALWYYGPQKWLMHLFTLKSQSKNFFYDNLRYNFAIQDYTESRNDRKFRSKDFIQRTEHLNIINTNLDAFKNLKNGCTLIYGFEANYNLVHSLGLLTDIYTGQTSGYSSRYPDGSTYKNFDFYAQVKKIVNDNLKLFAGIRVSKTIIEAQFDTTFYNFPFSSVKQSPIAPTGMLGAIIKLPADFNLSINLSTGFRAPNIDDLGKVFDSEPGNVIVPNPDLKPEYLYNVEFGLKKYTANFYINFASFYSYLDNAMVRRDFTFNGADSIFYDGTFSKVEALVNAGYAIIYGVQAETGVRIGKNIVFKTASMLTKGIDDEGNPLRHVVPPNIKSSILYKNKKITAQFSAIYTAAVPYDKLSPSEQSKPYIYAIDENGNPYCPKWYTLDFRMQYLVSRTVHLNFAVENILDQRYRPYSSGIVASGRNFIFSLKFRL